MIEIYNEQLTEQPVREYVEFGRETVICDISGKAFAAFDIGHDMICCNSIDELTAYISVSMTGGKDIDIVIFDDTAADAGSVSDIREYYLKLLALVKKVVFEKKSGSRLIVFYKTGDDILPYNEALAPIGRSAAIIGGELKVKTVGIDKDTDLTHDIFVSELNEKGFTDSTVVYSGGKRFIKSMVPCCSAGAGHGSFLTLDSDSAVVITGASGRIAGILARAVAERCRAGIILISRSRNRQIDELIERYSGRISFIKCDINNSSRFEAVLSEAVAGYSRCAAIINTAGNNDGKYFISKNKEDMECVFAPKLSGAFGLFDYACKHPVDRLILFSSSSAFFGDLGQVDYSLINRFTDVFADYADKYFRRSGIPARVISAAWPLWRNGGMHMEKGSEAAYLAMNKSDYLEDEEGAALLFDLMTDDEHTDLLIIKKKDSSEVKKMSEKSYYSGADDISSELRNIIYKVIDLEPERISENRNFSEMGFDSISFREFAAQINKSFGLEILPIDFFSCTNLKLLAEKVAKEYAAVKENSEINAASDMDPFAFLDDRTDTFLLDKEVSAVCSDRAVKCNDVAVIGAECIMPDADDILEFWDNLTKGRCSVKSVPAERLTDGCFKEGTDIKACFIDRIKGFDGEFFGITPRNCDNMDPQQRLYIEVVWKAFERAGYRLSDLEGEKVGVFTGVQHCDYKNILMQKGILDGSSVIGTDPTMLSNYLSYIFDLHGPSESVNTACSSSLTAVHRAADSVRNGECEMAVAGGVSLLLNANSFTMADSMGIISPKNICSALDESADGYVKGEGIGAIILKPLDKAVRDGDNILAVIKASGVNHGGRAQSITSPNEEAQLSLVTDTFEKAGISPDTVSYMELHGTGTKLGDPIEVRALKRAYEHFGVESRGTVAIGSLKNNIGHLEPASGIASMIKVIMCLREKTLVPHINYSNENPYLKLSETPFYVNTELRQWSTEKIRRATVSSFGFGGANAFVILEEAPEKRSLTGDKGTDRYVFVLSAKTEQRLMKKAEQFRTFLADKRASELDRPFLADMCSTLQLKREEYEHRLAIVFSRAEELLSCLSDTVTGAGCINVSAEIPDSDITVRTACTWCEGGHADWSSLNGGRRFFTADLPPEPFMHRDYWFDSFCQKKPDTKHTAEKKSYKYIPSVNTDVSETVFLEYITDEICVLHLNYTEQKNMFTKLFLSCISEKLSQVKQDKRLKALIVTGYGNIFSMGGSKEELMSLANGDNEFSDADGAVIYSGFAELDIPVISAIQGYAFGGGLIFGLYGDIVILSNQGSYSANFMKYGFTPGLGSTFLLRHKLGDLLANEMMYTAHIYTGKELSTRCTGVIFEDQEDVMTRAVSIAREIAGKTSRSLAVLKHGLGQKYRDDLKAAIELELEMHRETITTAESRQRIDRLISDSVSKSSAVRSDSAAVLELNKQVVPPALKRESIELQPLDNTSAEKKQDSGMLEYVVSVISGILHIPESEIDSDITLHDLGIDSINMVELSRIINNDHMLDIDASELYDYSTPERIARLISERTGNDRIVPERKQIPVQNVSTEEPEAEKEDMQDIYEGLTSIISEILHLPSSDIDINDSFSELGMDSINMIELSRRMKDTYDVSVDASELYDYNSVKKASQLIGGDHIIQESSSGDSEKSVLEMLKGIDDETDLDDLDKYLTDLL